jgi:hypothetical protein
MALSVIDSLSKGFQAVYRRWWLVLIPILLDSLLWLGPRLSVHSLLQETMVAVEAQLSEVSSQENSDWADTLRTTFEDTVARYNAFAALRVGVLSMPSLLTWGGVRLGSPPMYEALWISFLGATNMSDLMVSVSDASFAPPAVWQIPNQGIWLSVVLGLTLVGIVAGSVYLTAIWQSLEVVADLLPFWQRTLRLGKRCVAFLVVRTVALLILGIPLVLVLALLSAISTGAAMLFGTIVLGLGSWLSFYLAFLAAALVTSDVSIWRAVWNSFNIVLRNFWSTLWLFVLINLIGGGLTLLWQQLSTGSWLTWIAIAGNAYIGSSLVAASLVFYQDRYQRWQQAIIELLSKTRQRMA